MSGRVRVPHTRGWGIGLALAAACVSGVAVFVNGFGVRRFADATVYTTAKNVVAAALLLGLLAATGAGRAGERAARGPANPRRRVLLVAMGVVGGSVPFVLFFEGLARASSVDAAFIQKTLVIWVALIAVPLLHERVGPLHVGAIALLVAGQAFLSQDLAAFRVGTGEALILIATLLWAVEFVVAKRLLASFSAPAVGAARMGLGSVVLLLWLLVTGRLGALAGLSAAQWGWALATGAILGVYVSTWFAALARAQAVDVAAALVFGAVITAILARGFQGVTITAVDAVGLLLIAAGAVTVVAAARRASPLEVRR